MMEKNIEKLQQYQDIIFLSEIGALIHDVGKLNDDFIKKHSIEGNKDPILSRYEHGDILEYDSNECNNFYPDDNILKQKSEKLKSLLEKITVSYNGKSSNLYSFIKCHHDKDPDVFVRLLKVSDSFDSEEDRSNASEQQPIYKTYYSNAFGYEKEIKVDYIEERKTVYDVILDILDTCDINKIKTKRRELLDNLKNSFSKTLGMTARAANDVTLWEHSYMMASIMKTLLCQSILENNFPVVKRKEEIESGKPFRIFSVGWDFFGFIEQSHTVPDVVGRINILEELKEELKDLIEIEFSLGNCVYEDNYGLHFLVPASLDDMRMIKDRVSEIVNEKTKGVLIPHLNLTDKGGRLTELLPKAIEELEEKIKKREIDFIPKWIDDWKNGLSRKKLICSICGKGFYYEREKEKICEICKEIRNKGREEKMPQTVFIDEIAWNGKDYENVALVVLNFELGNWLNGKFVKSLFINVKWEKGDNIKGLRGKIEGKLRGKFDWNEDTKSKIRNAISELLHEKGAIKGRFIEEICSIAINKIEERIKEGQNLLKILEEERNTYTLTKEIFSDIEFLEEVQSKTPSPSRLMRVWNNTKEFFEELSHQISENSPVIERYVLAIDRSLNIERRAWEVEIGVEGKKEQGEVVFNGKDCITVTPHINKFIEENRDAQLKIKVIDREWENTENEFPAKFKEKRNRKGYRIISISPNMFMFLIPASKIFELISAVKRKYMEQFGKVYGKLPLNVGIVYFKRKTPFFAVLDSAKRFTRCFKYQEDLKKEILDIKKNKIITDIGIIELPHKLGDGKPDYYHPYTMVEEGGITLSDIRVKHVLSLKKGEKIKIYPSCFDFQYLDTTTRRFNIVLEEDKKRIHPIIGNKGPRPYLLEELDKFKRLEEIFKMVGSWTPIRDVEAIAASKRKEWGEGEIYEKLVDSALENELENKLRRFFDDEENWRGNIKPFLLKCIMEGSFFDAIELFKSIMKMVLRGDRK